MGSSAGLGIKRIHHVAIICRDYARSKAFYVETLGFRVLRETLRESRASYKLDLAVDGHTQIELFSFPDPPARLTRPEAAGLRHLAFEVDDLTAAVGRLVSQGVAVEEIRLDELTGRRFAFFRDPDDLPIELYEISETRRDPGSSG